MATVGKEVSDYLISLSKPFRKPGAETSSFTFPSQLPREDEVKQQKLKFKLYMSSLSTSSLNKK